MHNIVYYIDMKGNIITEKYEILKNPKFRPVANTDYGQIFDIEKDAVMLWAYYVPDCFKTYGYHCLAVATGLQDCCEVIFDDLYLRYFRDNPYLFAPLMMHELGHFVNGDTVSTESLTPSRTDFISIGLVDPREIKADRFAAENIGAKRLIKALQYIKEKRASSNRKGNDQAVKELEKRIRVLRMMVQDES